MGLGRSVRGSDSVRGLLKIRRPGGGYSNLPGFLGWLLEMGRKLDSYPSSGCGGTGSTLD